MKEYQQEHYIKQNSSIHLPYKYFKYYLELLIKEPKKFQFVVTHIVRSKKKEKTLSQYASITTPDSIPININNSKVTRQSFVEKYFTIKFL